MQILSLFSYFPEKISNVLTAYFKENTEDSKSLEEIRVRNGKPIILKFNKKEVILKVAVDEEDILRTLQKLCENSIYSYQKQLSQGFITIKGGHRIGVCGNCVVEDNKVTNIKYISSLNFRIAREIRGASNKVIKYILNVDENNIYTTLIASPPGVGKTTMLRDIIRRISTGINSLGFNGINVGLVDERGEIAAMYKGSPQTKLGIRTDVLDNVSKAEGMKMLIRSMAPKVIAADEIGENTEIEAINYALCSGIKGIFTAHGETLEEILINPTLKKLLHLKVFERIIFLQDNKEKAEINKIYALDKSKLKYVLLEERNDI